MDVELGRTRRLVARGETLRGRIAFLTQAVRAGQAGPLDHRKHRGALAGTTGCLWMGPEGPVRGDYWLAGWLAGWWIYTCTFLCVHDACVLGWIAVLRLVMAVV